MQAKLTDEAAAGWDQLATRRNVTFTALMEALGELLAASEVEWVPDEAIARAHELDRQRRSRR